MSLAGKNMLVVGGSSGIGLSLVKLLQVQGANVFVISRSRSEQWAEDVHFLQADVTEEINLPPDFLPEQLHGLVYAVGSITLKPFNRLTTVDFLTDFTLNVLGAARIVQQSLKSLKSANGSSVVLIGSVAARAGMPFHGSIAAAKGALEAMALTMAAEFASQQIRVNLVAPSLTDTPLAEKLLNSPEKQEGSAKRHPLGRYGQPEDISSMIAFLLSDQSSWMTGQVIGIDGGLGKLKTM
ncbi:SDR family NAD(P)-dependent oxidoreductase [Pedobacter duraquae]|uniref:NAD(P)-dependent dehydrogenase (Short-subunit alcohol dehydrogenase family) n=1 Tax=Pedobacter duraquae TaxID=425511 RepID=A0A4R6IFZ5_9SPHI|nr:SDR family oxidoreductase [Pedobacter duraquae]TDO21283.1 NAD(P)-dependent dehydrogenase (short-subunit alcohol dehydrogenase family) [Pedobacter duraquae]